MTSPAGDVNFAIDIVSDPAGLHATLLNATDRQPFTSEVWDGKTLTLRFDYYDGTLTAHFALLRRMQGEYSRLTSKGVIHIPLTLIPHAEATELRTWNGPSLTGEWRVHEIRTKGMEVTIPSEFHQQEKATADGRASVTGILEPVSGDSGLMHGEVFTAGGGTHFHLSRFDGIHAMAMDGEFESDGSLQGKVAYNTTSAVPFTAQRMQRKAAATPDKPAGSVTHVSDPQQPFRFRGVDAQNRTLNQDSPEFKGRPLLIDIFGTWCPNCHDEAPVLESLYRKYRDQGLVVVGLAYEYNDDGARDLRLIGIYREKYHVTFPLLLAGTTDEGQIARTLPQLVGFGAYPTTIFVARDGRVRAIHAGFEGPSTGDKYQQAQEMLDRYTREIVSGAP